MQRAIDGLNNYSFHIIAKSTTLCRTYDTLMSTFNHLMMVEFFHRIEHSTSCKEQINFAVLYIFIEIEFGCLFFST